jgi:hypothetical protein
MKTLGYYNGKYDEIEKLVREAVELVSEARKKLK